ncbi:GNAT family N-acetyltransferase [bacterium]|jgi:ribosomal-protein-alanine N-acetyltransferase|nr:GNAT family N-acetyltransferase [bacterium]
MGLNHVGSVEIVTERLILRRLKESDKEDIYTNLAHDKLVSKTFKLPYYENIDNMNAFMTTYLSRSADINTYFWVIELKKKSEAIGIFVTPSRSDSDFTIEVGWALGSNYWGKGYAAEALRAVIKFFFTEIGYNRITAAHFVGHDSSGLVMEKAGMRYEGMRRQEVFYRGQFIDTENYYILREEWNF